MTRVLKVKSLDLQLLPGEWDFALAERTRIDAHWRELAARNPAVWNGDVLICRGADVIDGRLSARFLKADYASFVAWRDWGWPDKMVCNCFGSAVIMSADGALIYGRMAGHTLNAGKVYPPGGSLESQDVQSDGRVDVIGSIVREMEEETGLKAANAERGELLAVFDEHRLSVAQIFEFSVAATELARAIRDYLKNAHDDELEDVEIVSRGLQTDPRMPGYAVAIAGYLLARRGVPKALRK